MHRTIVSTLAALAVAAPLAVAGAATAAPTLTPYHFTHAASTTTGGTSFTATPRAGSPLAYKGVEIHCDNPKTISKHKKRRFEGSTFQNYLYVIVTSNIKYRYCKPDGSVGSHHAFDELIALDVKAKHQGDSEQCKGDQYKGVGFRGHWNQPLVGWHFTTSKRTHCTNSTVARKHWDLSFYRHVTFKGGRTPSWYTGYRIHLVGGEDKTGRLSTHLSRTN